MYEVDEVVSIFRTEKEEFAQDEEDTLDIPVHVAEMDLYSPSASSLSLPSESYIYSLCPSGASSLAAISSDNSLRRFDRNTLALLPDGVVKDTHPAGVSSLCTADGDGLLATCGKDGTVKVWDGRSSGAVAVFETEKGMPLLSVACNASSHSIVAGTELVKSDAFVLFWDIRSPGKPRRQLVESHNDDVTEVQFHPARPSVLLSGSTDGLVNIYDTTVSDEDDALLQVIKHSSIHHAGFVDDTAVYALSHDELFSVHPITCADEDEPVDQVKAVEFGDLRPILKAEYVVQVLVDKVGSYVVSGRTSDRSLSLTPLLHTPEFHFDQSNSWTLPGAHGAHGEEVVRSVFFDSESRTVFTCGEDGHVRVWKEKESVATAEPDTIASRRPTKPSRKEKGYKPY
ncbi:WD domain-containing protein [Arthroderma uncinatum]|uniref:WD domain-containing protein n=1 Tax=Arthroderma uncinatum TaxID=74035 RepID=UPI00144AA6BD|nr:WD domain-containing protein [Arthroderma uncinatum]KAF3481290.1 WD domain-containing protein [Arthroderma uncinatum]